MTATIRVIKGYKGLWDLVSLITFYNLHNLDGSGMYNHV